MQSAVKLEPTYQATSDALYNLAASKGYGQKGRDAIKAVLATFGAKHLQSIAPDQYAAVIGECVALQTV